MATRAIRECDTCQTLDSLEARVRRVSIAGPKLDLCPKCRVGVMVAAGIDEEKAIAYVAMSDARETQKGNQPTLESVEETESETETEEVEVPAEETPASGRRRK